VEVTVNSEAQTEGSSTGEHGNVLRRQRRRRKGERWGKGGGEEDAVWGVTL
jgi:hypothetical protein